VSFDPIPQYEMWSLGNQELQTKVLSQQAPDPWTADARPCGLSGAPYGPAGTADGTVRMALGALRGQNAD
jgi:hypothetical protein